MFNTRQLIQRFIKLNNITNGCQNVCRITANQSNHLRNYAKNVNDDYVFDESIEILDVVAERRRYQEESALALQNEQKAKLDELNLKSTMLNVLNIENLIEVLHKENAEDIFVCAVPSVLKYVDYFVICSARSYRHSLAIVGFVRRLFKSKHQGSKFVPHIEGINSKDWIAVDLGNIALHIMSAEAREKYNLESLWAIGADYDHDFNKPKDSLDELFDKYIMPMTPSINNQKTNTIIGAVQNKPD